MRVKVDEELDEAREASTTKLVEVQPGKACTPLHADWALEPLRDDGSFSSRTSAV